MTETELEYQFCFNCNDRKQCYTKPKDCTRIQEEIGLQEMTNEEWLCDYFNNEFRAMPTEKKAEVIADFILRLEELNCNKLAWMKWLKEKHSE